MHLNPWLKAKILSRRLAHRSRGWAGPAWGEASDWLVTWPVWDAERLQAIAPLSAEAGHDDLVRLKPEFWKQGRSPEGAKQRQPG